MFIPATALPLLWYLLLLPASAAVTRPSAVGLASYSDDLLLEESALLVVTVGSFKGRLVNHAHKDKANYRDAGNTILKLNARSLFLISMNTLYISNSDFSRNIFE